MRLTITDLAKLANVGEATIKRVEAGSGLPSANVRTIDAIIRAFQNAGVEFVGSSDDRPGVRLK